MRERTILWTLSWCWLGLWIGTCLGLVGCEAVAAGLRVVADVASSEPVKAVAGAAANSVGLGWLWGLLGGAGGAAVPAIEAVRRANRNGDFVDGIAEVLDTFKGKDGVATTQILAAIAAQMRNRGRDGQFDGFLKKCGRNKKRAA